MNKYQEALKFLTNKADDLCQSMTNKILVINNSKVLKELIDKEDKYKWHTDPNDLPKCSELINYYSVDVIVKLGDNAYEIGWYNFIQNRWICPIANAYGLEIKAWKYIEQFEGEKDEKQKEHK